jgi:hypothetical protein
MTYLHDELNGTNEVHEELQDQVLLLLLHLVQTVLLTALLNLRVGQTGAGAGLQQLLGNGTRTTGLVGLLVLRIDVGILGLELLDERVHVLVLFFFVIGRGLGRRHLLLLLIELTRGHRGAQVVRGHRGTRIRHDGELGTGNNNY